VAGALLYSTRSLPVRKPTFVLVGVIKTPLITYHKQYGAHSQKPFFFSLIPVHSLDPTDHTTTARDHMINAYALYDSILFPSPTTKHRTRVRQEKREKKVIR